MPTSKYLCGNSLENRTRPEPDRPARSIPLPAARKTSDHSGRVEIPVAIEVHPALGIATGHVQLPGPTAAGAELPVCAALFESDPFGKPGAEPTEGDAPDRWGGEPAAVLDRRTPSQLFEQIALDLQEADVVRLVGAEWIKEGELSDGLDRVIGEFKARGGKVQVTEGTEGTDLQEKRS